MKTKKMTKRQTIGRGITALGLVGMLISPLEARSADNQENQAGGAALHIMGAGLRAYGINGGAKTPQQAAGAANAGALMDTLGNIEDPAKVERSKSAEQ